MKTIASVVINSILPSVPKVSELPGYAVATLRKGSSNKGVISPARKPAGQVYTIHQFYNVTSTTGLEALREAKQVIHLMRY
jgi:hypothetical protein